MDFEFIKNSLLDIEKKFILSLQCPESKNMLYESIKNNINIIYRNIDSFARSCKEAKNKDKHIRSIVRSIMMSTNDNGIINSASEICRNLDIIMKGVYDSREIEQKAKKLNSEIYLKDKECTCPIFRALGKEGLRWNPETEEIEPIRWRAKRGKRYYSVDRAFGISIYKEEFDSTDDGLWNSGNYFSTEKEAQKYADEFRRMSQERTLDKEE